MSKLKDIVSKTKVTHIEISYGKETFKFNLMDELQITPNRINSELEKQPSYYGFLLLLRNRLLTVKEDAKREVDKTYGKLYMGYCEDTNPKTGRPYADKAARELVMKNKKYNELVKKSIKAQQDFNDIDACVRAFEQKSNLIQTLSANLRSEK